MSNGSGEGGAGLVAVLLAVLLLSALGLAVALAAFGDALASGNVAASRETLYAADAGIERALPDLQDAPDWDLVLSGSVTSGFTDGAPAGERVVEGGGAIVLDELINLANCGRRAACDEAAMAEVTEERPWGADNPRWRPFAWGPLSGLAGAGTPGYLVVLVADDPMDGDGNPQRDAPGASAGSGVVLLRAQAYGRAGASRVIEAAVARTGRRTPIAGYTGQRGGTGYTTGEAGAGLHAGDAAPAQTPIVLDEGEAGR